MVRGGFTRMLVDEPAKPADVAHEDADVRAEAQPTPESDARASALWGVPCVIGAAFSFSIHGASVKVATASGFSLLQLSFLIGTIRLLCAVLILPFQRRWWRNILCTGQPPSFVLLVVFRNVVGCTALFSIYNALSRLPLGEGTSLVFTAPIWVTVLAYVWLGEPITRYNVAAALLAVGGVSLIASGQSEVEGAVAAAEAAADLIGLGDALPTLDEPPAHSERQLGIACALFGAVALSLVMVTTRKIGHQMPAVVSIGWYGALSAAAAALALLALAQPLVPPAVPAATWAVMVSSGALSFVGQMLNTMALQRLEAGPVQILATLEIVFSFIWQATFLGSSVRPRAALGALIIVSAAALIAIPKILSLRKPLALAGAPHAEAHAADADEGQGIAMGRNEVRSRIALRLPSVSRAPQHVPLPVQPAAAGAADDEEAEGRSAAKGAHA